MNRVDMKNVECIEFKIEFTKCRWKVQLIIKYIYVIGGKNPYNIPITVTLTTDI